MRLFSSLSDRISKRFVQKYYKEKHDFLIRLQSQTPFDSLPIILGSQSNTCPSGWNAFIMGTTRKCLFTSKSKVEIDKLETFCQGLNATVPYPKTDKENQNYLDAFKARNLTSVAIRSYHGIVELHRKGYWIPFPTDTSLHAICEKVSMVKTDRTKRQASSGKKILVLNRSGCLWFLMPSVGLVVGVICRVSSCL